MKFSPNADDINTSERSARAKVSPFDAALVMTYFAKVRQADLYMRDPKISALEIPHLVAEASATGKTIANVAKGILNEHRNWATDDAGLEGKRLQRNKNRGKK